MTELLIKLVKNKHGENVPRSAYGYLSGITGIVCNLLLCAAKFAVGILTGALSVTADAVNNLTDCAASIVTLTGTKLSDKPDDKEHPFGHGRIEYISALIVAISVFVVSLELAKSSFLKILHPEEMKFSARYAVILGVTVLIKIWMAYFNSRLYKLTDNLNLKGVMTDSINDAIVTSATIISMLLSHAFGLNIADGIAGLGISVFIFLSGMSILKDVLSPLIGEPPSKEVTERIEQIVCESDIVLGMHDLIIHSYGKNRALASADAEVRADSDIFEIHDAIDRAERKILDELGIVICIHTDPVDTSDSEAERIRNEAEEIIKDYDSSFSFHDLRITEVDGIKRLSFDLAIPFDRGEEKSRIKEALEQRFSEKYTDMEIEINIEHSYV